MKNNYVLDTNFLSSLINTNDVLHLKAISKYDLIKDSILMIPATVAFELSIFLNKYFGQNNIENIIKELELKFIEIDENFVYSFANYLHKNNLNLKPMDSSILFTALLYKAELITFDEKLNKIYKSLIKD